MHANEVKLDKFDAVSGITSRGGRIGPIMEE
jgi:hypothetical protein